VLKKKIEIKEEDLPRNVRKAMEKFNEDNFVKVDLEKAMMLANSQGNTALSMNMQINGS